MFTIYRIELLWIVVGHFRPFSVHYFETRQHLLSYRYWGKKETSYSSAGSLSLSFSDNRRMYFGGVGTTLDWLPWLITKNILYAHTNAAIFHEIAIEKYSNGVHSRVIIHHTKWNFPRTIFGPLASIFPCSRGPDNVVDGYFVLGFGTFSRVPFIVRTVSSTCTNKIISDSTELPAFPPWSSNGFVYKLFFSAVWIDRYRCRITTSASTS